MSSRSRSAGGTVVLRYRWRRPRLGPDSVGYRLPERGAGVRRPSTPTLTDAAALARRGDGRAQAEVPRELPEGPLVGAMDSSDDENPRRGCRPDEGRSWRCAARGGGWRIDTDSRLGPRSVEGPPTRPPRRRQRHRCRDRRASADVGRRSSPGRRTRCGVIEAALRPGHGPGRSRPARTPNGWRSSISTRCHWPISPNLSRGSA